MDNSWLTEEYMSSLGYYKLSDNGQYGVYLNNHLAVKSITYGQLPKDYRKISFNRDDKYGVFLGVRQDWDTRYSINQALAQNKQVFEILLNACV